MLRTEAATLARTLMNQHGLTDWTFQWDNAKRRFGQCVYNKKTIKLSSYLVSLNSAEQVRDTILHEIAHALAGARHGHNHVWRAKCLEVGARPDRCYSSEEVELPAPRWVGTCPSCGYQTTRYRLKKGARTLACADCCDAHNGGRYDSRFVLKWRETERGTHHPEIDFVDSLPTG